MKKVDGLKLLARNFPEITIDSSFIQNHKQLPALFRAYGEADRNSYWRIRCANPSGSEFGLPMGSFYSNETAEQFIKKIETDHPEYSYILHRINDDYYYPAYCGTLEVSSSPEFEVVIELQKVTREMIDNMDTGVRPRDWTSSVCLRQNVFQAEPQVAYSNREEVASMEGPLAGLYAVGVKLCVLYALCGIQTISYTRFNICKDGSIVLNDHRGSGSFMNGSENRLREEIMLSVRLEERSPEEMRAWLRERCAALGSGSRQQEEPAAAPPPRRALLRGLGAAKGKADGVALVLDELFFASDDEEKAVNESRDRIVIVCRTITPELIRVCRKAAAIVTDQGGITSHAAILSRELGIPCVTGSMNGTQLIKNGSHVWVNGLTGEVYYGTEIES